VLKVPVLSSARRASIAKKYCSVCEIFFPASSSRCKGGSKIIRGRWGGGGQKGKGSISNCSILHGSSGGSRGSSAHRLPMALVVTTHTASPVSDATYNLLVLHYWQGNSIKTNTLVASGFSSSFLLLLLLG
jgi:hypothetical protein